MRIGFELAGLAKSLDKRAACRAMAGLRR